MAAAAEHLTPRPKLLARLRASSLFRREVPAARAWDVIGWWESRRIPYNLIVGSAGVASCSIAGLLVLSYSALEHRFLSGDIGNPFLSVMAIVFYAVCANALYTLGWIAELVVRTLWPSESERFGKTSFFLGLLLSVFLTLTPGIIFLSVAIAVGIAKLAGVYH